MHHSAALKKAPVGLEYGQHHDQITTSNGPVTSHNLSGLSSKESHVSSNGSKLKVSRRSDSKRTSLETGVSSIISEHIEACRKHFEAGDQEPPILILLDVTPEVYGLLCERLPFELSRVGKGLHYSYNLQDKELILRLPLPIHQFVARCMEDLIRFKTRELVDSSPKLRKLGPLISYNKELKGKGSKIPDGMVSGLECGYPPLVIEVSYSQDSNKLPEIAEDYYYYSDYNIKAIITISMQYWDRGTRYAMEDSRKKKQQELEQIVKELKGELSEMQREIKIREKLELEQECELPQRRCAYNVYTEIEALKQLDCFEDDQPFYPTEGLHDDDVAIKIKLRDLYRTQDIDPDEPTANALITISFAELRKIIADAEKEQYVIDEFNRSDRTKRKPSPLPNILAVKVLKQSEEDARCQTAGSVDTSKTPSPKDGTFVPPKDSTSYREESYATRSRASSL
jgi:hypothetical protein